MNNDLRYIEMLDRIAQDSEPVGNARIAACLVFKKEILAYGFNKYKTHPMQRKFGRNDASIFLHAEIDCIINALRNNTSEILEKSTLYISRVKYSSPRRKKFIRGLSKPCAGCSKCIAQFNIKRVVYTCDDGNTSEL